MYYAIYNKLKGYLSDNEIEGLYYSESINAETLKFETSEDADLLCNMYETAIKITVDNTMRYGDDTND